MYPKITERREQQKLPERPKHPTMSYWKAHDSQEKEHPVGLEESVRIAPSSTVEIARRAVQSYCFHQHRTRAESK